MGSALPYPADLFDSEIESIRSFDADTSARLQVAEIRLLPARDFHGRPGATSSAAATATPSRRPSKAASTGREQRRRARRIEYYLPLFFEQTAAIFDYLPKGASVCLHGQVHDRSPSSGATRKGATSSSRATARGPCSRPLRSSSPPRNFSCAQRRSSASTSKATPRRASAARARGGAARRRSLHRLKASSPKHPPG